jgi:ABC-2 type transport system permease protein
MHIRGQIRAILWAQFRTARNYLPRTNYGTILAWLFSCIWYGLFCAVGVGLAGALPRVPVRSLPLVVSFGLLGILIFWQVVPLMTLSSGSSLDLSKLLVYPIHKKTLFAIEVLLRLTTSPEMIVVLCGGIIGLMRHPRVFVLSPLWLVLYVPLNLFLSLGLREWVATTVERKKLRVILVIFSLSASLVPSLFLNTSLGERSKPFFLAAAKAPGTPWSELSSLGLGHYSLFTAVVLCAWLAAAYIFAARQFARSLNFDQARIPGPLREPGAASPRLNWAEPLLALPGRLFRDPLGALVEKEIRVLSRSSRFRVVFGIATVFSVLVFIPFSSGRLSSGVMSRNYLPAVSAYGMMIIGEILLWNNLGFDRNAAQLYFVAPVPFAVVLKAKNVAACVIILLMTLFVALITALVRQNVTPGSFASSIALTSVLTLFFLAFGNLASVIMPRPVDPSQALRRQNSAKASLWLMLSFIVLIVPLGPAFAARWAFDSDWPFFTILAIDVIVGAITYRIATESAIARANRNREQILHALSRGSNPIE